ncbi:nucleotidyltransferase family protein [Cerasicoccus maritimus]|uniref:nucleotidyltransferase family protein n=1 Tax=Cerasicoccus maritimus TaxID=490089 RepID=UPI002852825A|nr:sugar phosphate nucleotidyltransferase [Cerasicoccus maritimus]
MTPPTLLILAAGMGSRYGGLKQLDVMGPMGETMLDFAVQDAISAGFAKIVFVIRRDFEADFHEHISSRYDAQIDLQFAYQSLEDLPTGFTPPPGRSKPWGTAQAIYAARNVIAEPFAVINADDFYGKESYEILATQLATAKGSDLAISMVGYQLIKTLSPHGSVNRGVCQIHGDKLKSVEEYTNISSNAAGVIIGKNLQGTQEVLRSETIVSMNCWGFTPAIFSAIQSHFIAFLKKSGSEMKSECYIPTVVDELIRSGAAECRIMQTSSPWFGVTYPEDKAHVVASLKELSESGQYA